MSGFSTQNLEKAIVELMRTINGLEDGSGYGGYGMYGLNAEQVIKLQAELKTKLTSIELHTAYVVAAYNDINGAGLEEYNQLHDQLETARSAEHLAHAGNIELMRRFQALQLDFTDMENQRNAALAQIEDLEGKWREEERRRRESDEARLSEVRRADDAEDELSRCRCAVLGARETQLHNMEQEIEELNRRLAHNEVRYNELLDASRAGLDRRDELERENDLLNAELAKLARPEEPEEAAHEWKSPQGIWFCRDNADIYGGGRGALWYLDEDDDEWKLTCWVGEDKKKSRAYRKEIDRQMNLGVACPDCAAPRVACPECGWHVGCTTDIDYKNNSNNYYY